MFLSASTSARPVAINGPPPSTARRHQRPAAINGPPPSTARRHQRRPAAINGPRPPRPSKARRGGHQRPDAINGPPPSNFKSTRAFTVTFRFAFRVTCFSCHCNLKFLSLLTGTPRRRGLRVTGS
jgi:hypothetical protein